MRLFTIAFLATACAPGVLLPDVDDAEFVSGITHPYWPLPVGATWRHEANGESGLERIEVSVPGTTRDVNGVTAVVVRDTVYVNDVMVEDTDDWYAQDSDGNLWYLGEETCEYENGECASTEGSWEWNVDGALPGFALPADPTVDGQPYYQEYYIGHAEDVGEVIEVGVDVTVQAGSYTGCITTRDTSTLDPDLLEKKTYCEGVGVVLVDEGDITEELVEYTAPEAAP
jgi:hypothetical protein